jgi:pyruvate kinase
VNVFRFNTKHGVVEWHEERIKRVQKVANELKMDIGILLDLQGPEIRLETKNKEKISVKQDQLIRIVPSFVKDDDLVCIPHQLVFDTLKSGDQILIDDGAIELVAEEVTSNYILARSIEDIEISHRKGVNLPGVDIDLPSLIDDDLIKLDMASTNKVDFVALSFCRSRNDIDILREQMNKRGIVAKIVAKIESQKALDNLTEIIETADVIMVARGDLGTEVPIERLANIQKQMIRKCRIANKPVITATQMLESMTSAPRPTRAEATDVANAVLDGTDAVMLSGETAQGKYPVKAVQAMAKISKYNEEIRAATKLKIDIQNETDLIVSSVLGILNQKVINFKFILVFTNSGKTARSISRLRPKMPILAITKDQKTVEELTISYGVEAHKSKLNDGDFSLPNKTTDWLLESGRINSGDTILVVHGRNYYEEGSTNAVAVYKF